MRIASCLVSALLLGLAFACGDTLVLGSNDPGPDAGDAALPNDGGSAGDASDGDASPAADGFPFDMTFERGIIGLDGANEAIDALESKPPLFGARSARASVNAATRLKRTFPPQTQGVISFYCRIDAGSFGTFFQLLGPKQPIVQVKAVGAGTSYSVTASFDDSVIPAVLGSVSAGERFRVGVRFEIVEGGTTVEIFFDKTGVESFAKVDEGQLGETASVTSIVFGNLDPLASGLDVSFDDAFGRADEFVQPSE